ncbi:MAG: methyltransferase domain-containing protein [Clostridiales bacterium]|nr:methyltransferase domain-containing protein [Clostridiales bacterium]
MQPFGALADVYDAMMDDFDYPKWAEYYRALLGRAGVFPGTIYDAGCGTGSMALEFARLGARVTGADLSGAMLRRAGEKFRAAGESAMLVCQDMCELSVPRPVDAVVSVCDGVNYLLTEARLRAFFRAARAAIRPGGALAFDISSRHKLEKRLGNAFLGEEREDIAYLWENRLDAQRHLVKMDVTFFVREADGRYRRFQERHAQRAHSGEELVELLGEEGFSGIEVFGDRTFAPPADDEERLHFLARRA